MIMDTLNHSSGQSTLRCSSITGEPRYDLPAWHIGSRDAYEIYWRPAPAKVIHHTKGRVTVLPQREFVMIGLGLHHCISISVDESGFPLGAYVNINMPPRRTPTGWCWEDLELDWILRVDHRQRWVPLLLDLPDFAGSSLTADQREIALNEVSAVLRQVTDRSFPFGSVSAPYLDIDLPSARHCGCAG